MKRRSAAKYLAQVSGRIKTEAYREALAEAIYSLRGPTREQVEKLRGEWEICEHALLTTAKCSKCGIDFQEYYGNFPFCPRCGSPMTDKAVDILLRRLEAMYDDTSD